MTEIPEHLLKRSRDRRAALGLGGDAGAAAGSRAGGRRPAATPATTASAAATPAAAAPPGRSVARRRPRRRPHRHPSPIRPTWSAAKTRNKIPFWAMAALGADAALGVHVRALAHHAAARPPARSASAPRCSAPAAPAATAPTARAARAVRSPRARSLKTFPHIEDQLRFVYFGTEQYNLANVAIYGNPDREGGPHHRLVRRRDAGMGQLAGGAPDRRRDPRRRLPRALRRSAAPTPQHRLAAEFDDWCADERRSSPAWRAARPGRPRRRRHRRRHRQPMPITTSAPPAHGDLTVGVSPGRGDRHDSTSHRSRSATTADPATR